MFKTINNGKLPTKGSKYSACVDLYANESAIIGAGETAIIPLGVCLDYNKFPLSVANNMKNFYLQLEPRSSMRAKGLIGGTGIIDIDFIDCEIKIILHNFGTNFTINKGDRIAQIMLCEHSSWRLGIETNDKRVGGIGSTNKFK
jgi:deoxyuridine 5'-triphosphate nucleotidohydrolase